MRPLRVPIASTLFGVSAVIALVGMLLASAAAQTVPMSDQMPLAQLGREVAKGGDGHLSRRDICPAPRLIGPLELASRLNAFEAFIGIRAHQLDVWRSYTDALQAMPASLEDERDLSAETGIAAQDLLAQSAELANDAAVQSADAARLLASVEALAGTLSEQQKRRLVEAGPLFPSKCSGRLARADTGTPDRKPC